MESSLELVKQCSNTVLKTRNIGRKTAGLVISFILAKKLYHAYQMYHTRVKIGKKQDELKKRKEKLKQSLLVDGVLLTDFRLSILELDITNLLAKLKAGLLDPVDVLQAYQAKALTVDVKINAVCDYITEAIDWATSLRQVPIQERGALYGLPMSIKECYLVKGYDATIGLARYIGKPAKDDCNFIKFLKDEHAIPFCLTNIPQTQISYACSNPIYGVTKNPHCGERTPGGSSGGEAALIASGASLLGLGADIGGSLRIPSHCSGITALKPTTSRIYEGGRVGAQGSYPTTLRPCISAVNGFMGADVAGVKLGMQTCINKARRMSREDWRVAPISWQEDLYQPGRKLKIGWFTHDGYFPPTPGCVRGVREVVDVLKEAGHELVEWKHRDHSELFKRFIETIISDLGYHNLKVLQAEIHDQAIELNVQSMTTSRYTRWFYSIILSFLSKKIHMMWNSHPTQTKDMFVTNARIDCLTEDFFSEWSDHGFDIVICPGFPIPAPLHKHASRLSSATSYTGVYNILKCPVGIIPVTKENAEDQEKLKDYKVNDDVIHRLARNSSIGAERCPISVQVIGRHFEEELVLHVMEIIENLVQYDSEIK